MFNSNYSTFLRAGEYAAGIILALEFSKRVIHSSKQAMQYIPLSFRCVATQQFYSMDIPESHSSKEALHLNNCKKRAK